MTTDEKVVDMNKVIEFYDRIYQSTPRQKVIAEIREFAERTIAIQNTMEPVIQYIKDNVIR